MIEINTKENKAKGSGIVVVNFLNDATMFEYDHKLCDWIVFFNGSVGQSRELLLMYVAHRGLWQKLLGLS